MAERFPCTPYRATKGVVYFARMLDKIRLHAAGDLPAVYHPFLGDAFDGRCLRFLGVTYEAVKERVAAGGSDGEILDWCLAHGHNPTEEQIEVWSAFMAKRGWRDDSSDRIVFRIKEAGLERLDAQCVTMFDFIDLDEGRTPPDFRKWEPPRLSAS